MPTRGIPYPAGDPNVPEEAEREHRRRLLLTALRALATPVTGPTIFELDEEEQEVPA